MYIMTVRDQIVHPGRVWVEINQTTEARTQRRDMRRTVDAAPAAETLPGWHNRSAAVKCRARLANMHARGARIGREMAQEFWGLRVRGVVVRGGTRLE